MYLPKKVIKRIKKVLIINILISLVIFFSLYIYSLNFALFFLYFYFILILISLYFTIPILKLPIPSGNFYIGTINYYLDNKEKDLPLHIWFPTNDNENMSNNFYLNNFMLENDNKIISLLIKNHSISNSERLSNNHSTFPIILVSHGLGSLTNFYTAQIQELVSHGYIVIGMNHINLSYFNENFRSFNNNKSTVSVEKVLEDKTGKLVAFLENEVEIGAKEILRILDFIEQLNENKKSLFYQKFNLDKIGMFGHSIGGAITAEVCRLDNRCKVGASLDGSLIQKTADIGFLKPFMFIVGYLLDKDENLINKRIRSLKINENHYEIFKKERNKILKLCNQIGKDSYYITLKNASHFAFTDFTLVSPILRLYLDFYIGADHKSEFSKEINIHLLNFFNKYLKNN